MPGAKKKEDTEINAAKEEIKEEELDYWTCDECGKISKKKNSLYVLHISRSKSRNSLKNII